MGFSHFLNLDLNVERGGWVLILGLISGAGVLGSVAGGGAVFVPVEDEPLTGAVFDGCEETVNCGAGGTVAGGDGFGSSGAGCLITGSGPRGSAADLGGSKLEE